MPGRLLNKVALVFGAGSIGEGWGNGKAAAVAYAREGARVVCADLDPGAADETRRIIEGEGGVAIACAVDVVKFDAITRTVDTALDAFGRSISCTTMSASMNPAVLSMQPRKAGIALWRSTQRGRS